MTDLHVAERNARDRLLINLINGTMMLIAALVVATALYVLAAGQLLALLSDRRAEVAGWLGERLDMRVEIGGIEAEMHFLTPVVRLHDVRVFMHDTPDDAALAAARLALEVAPFKSLWSQQPVLDLLRIDGMTLAIEEMEDGQFRVKGMPFRVNDPDAAERLRQALLVVYAQTNIVVERARIVVESASLPFTEFNDIRLRMHNNGDQHALAGAANLLGQGRLPVSFVMQFAGTPVRPADIVADIYLRVQPSSLEGWLPRRDIGDVWIDALGGGGDAWLRLDRGRLDDVRGRLQVDTLSLSLAGGEKVEGVLGLVSRFHWRGAIAVATDAATASSAEKTAANGDWRDAWSLTLSQLNFRRQGKAWPEADAAIEYRRDDQGQIRVRGVVTRGNIEMLAGLTDFLPLNAAIERLKSMAPRGQLNDLRVDWDEAALPASRWHVSAALAQAGWGADAGVPGVQGLSGRVDVSPETGVADLLVEAPLQWPSLFAEPLPLNSAAIKVIWQRQEKSWLLRSNRFTIKNPDARASGLFTLELPDAASGLSAQLQLLAMIEDGRGASTARYLPSTTSPGVRQWLGAALQAGNLRRGSFLFDGPVRRESATLAQRTFQMRYEANGLTLAFLPNWPLLQNADADVFIANGHVDARGRRGQLLDSLLDNIRVTVTPEGDDDSRLDVQAHLDGDLGNVFTLFRETSLKPVVPAELLRWDGSGRLNAQVRVNMPLAHSGGERVTVEGTVGGGTLNSAAHDLEISDVSGALRYDTRDGFSARELRGTALGTVLVGNARTVKEDGQLLTLVDLNGRLRMPPLNAWLRLPVLELLRGDADAALTLRFGGNADAGMEVRSDLRGISSAAPAPLGKSADSAVDTRFFWALGTEKPRMNLVYGKALAADVVLESGVPAQGAISLGNVRLPAFGEGRGLVVEGATGELSIPDWLAFLEKMVDPRKAAANAVLLRDTPVARTVAGIAALGDSLQRVNINVERMETGSLTLDSAALKIARNDEGFRVSVASRQGEAALQVPVDYRIGDERPLDVQIERISLPVTSSAQASGIAAAISPLALPPLNLTARNLRIGNVDYGSWSLEATPQARGVTLQNVQGNWRELGFFGQGEWLADERGQRTLFAGVASAVDIARVSEAFGFEPNLGSTAAQVDFSLEWPGRPDDIDSDRVKGKLKLDLRDGRFVTASAKSQALRAFGVFNLGTWQRRMKLDFTDLYKRGVAFDTLTGEISIDAGRLSTSNLVAKGPSAMFEVSGSTVLSSHALDTKVRVTLPVNSNLYVGCLAGLAACAGIVAFEQLWGDRLEKLTTLGYEVRGSWEDPQIKQIETGVNVPVPKG